MRRAALLLGALLLQGVLAAGPAPAQASAWLKGDWHVHTTYSGDVCDLVNAPLSPKCDEPWTWGFTPREQIQNAELRGLDYLALTDHNTVAQQGDPGYQSDKLVLVPGYEHSLTGGHAGITGVGRTFRNMPSGTDAQLNAIIEAVHQAGGIFTVNHPASTGPAWEYGSAVQGFDAIEIWNIHWLFRGDLVPVPGAPGNNNPQAVKFWESYLDRGFHVAALGGSDSHWRATVLVQGPGQPATWVYAQERSLQGVLDGVRAGRTFVSRDFLGPQLYLEADADGDGNYEAMVGDTVPAGPVALRARVVDGVGNVVRFVVDGQVAGEQLVAAPSFTAEATLDLTGKKWVRADLLQHDDLVYNAFTSAIYVGD